MEQLFGLAVSKTRFLLHEIISRAIANALELKIANVRHVDSFFIEQFSEKYAP